jgi:tetratricopeptide (TPR) repeat protein
MIVMPAKKCFIVPLLFALAMGLFTVYAGYYEDAYKAYKAKNYDEAIQILEEGVSAAPNDEQLMNLLGQTYFKIKQYDKAIETLKRTTLLDPEIHSAYYLLGHSFTLQKVDGVSKPAWFEASQAFEQAIKLKPDEFRYLYNFGHSLLELKKYQQAIEPLQKAYNTEKGSTNFKTALDLGLAYQLVNQKDEALKYLEISHQLNPDKYQPLKYLGNLYLEKEMYDKVTAIGSKLIAQKPTLSSGYIFRGVGQLQTKDYAGAKETFQKAIELDAKDQSAYYHLGLALEGLLGSNARSFRQLIDAYGKAVNLAEGSIPSDWHYRLGHAYELESHLDWERSVRNSDARNRCLRNLRLARDSYTKAGDKGSSKERLGIVNERIRQLEIIQ